MQKTLVNRDSKGKIRVVDISCNWCDQEHAYILERYTCQYMGKVTKHADIIINKGKAGRTVTEQAKQEYASHVKKYMDKGYKQLDNDISTYDIETLNNIVGEYMTDAQGVVKPMLAKAYDKVASSTLERGWWYGSRKLDGVRCLMYYDGDEIHTASRGGGDYDPSMYQFLQHPVLLNYFKENPDTILDGEIYRHGYSLQKISGLARLEKDVTGCYVLEYWIFDIVSQKPFQDRLETLNEFFDQVPYKEDTDESMFGEDDLRIRRVSHKKVEGWLQMKKLHDQYVNEGFEGLIIRNPDKPYGIGKRSNDMIKIKNYQSEEFEVVGYEEGLRPTEDMVFIMKTSDGIQFKAKPMGDRDEKQWYINNMDVLIGKMGEVKYFYLSDEGTPLQPVFKAFRIDDN